MGTVFKAILPVAFKSSPVFSPSANQSQHQVKTISWRIFKLPKEACKKKKEGCMFARPHMQHSGEFNKWL